MMELLENGGNPVTKSRVTWDNRCPCVGSGLWSQPEGELADLFWAQIGQAET